MKQILSLFVVCGVFFGMLSCEKDKDDDAFLCQQCERGYRVLSLNNSLIDCNDQPGIFNNNAAEEGKDAYWIELPYGGQDLQYHYEEGASRYLVVCQCWTHIILQEKSSRPITDISGFRLSIRKWVKYIKARCPNPDVKIILAMNWPSIITDDWARDMATLKASYQMVAEEFNLAICPVGMAYDLIRETEGKAALNTMFVDQIHPTVKASYMAACMEYKLLFDESPVGLPYKPEGILEEEAIKMQNYAEKAFNDFMER